MAVQSLARRQRLFTGLPVIAGSIALAALGSQPGLRDFAFIVGLCALVPLYALIHVRLPSWRLRLAAALALWCGLWAPPVLRQQAWNWGAGSGGHASWWSEVAPDLAPFFAVPVAVLVVIALLRREGPAAAGSAGRMPASPPPESPRPEAG